MGQANSWESVSKVQREVSAAVDVLGLTGSSILPELCGHLYMWKITTCIIADMDFSSGWGPSEASGLKAQRMPADLAEVPKALLDTPSVLPATTLLCASFILRLLFICIGVYTWVYAMNVQELTDTGRWHQIPWSRSDKQMTLTIT